MSIQYTDTVVALDQKIATVANTSALPIDVSKRQLVSLQLNTFINTTGSCAFGVEVTNDMSNWVVYNRLTSNLTNSNSQTDTRVAAPTVTTAGTVSSMYFIPDYFRAIRVFATITGNVVATAIVQAAG